MVIDALTADIPEIVRFAAEMHAESRYAPYNFDADKLGDLLDALIESPMGIVLIFKQDGEALGAFAGYVQPHFFGNDLASMDYGVFVRPGKRGAFVGAALIQAYIERATELGAKDITLSNSTGYKTEKIAEYYKSIGFTQNGYTFSMGANL